MLINSTKTLIQARDDRLVIENKIFDLFNNAEIRNVLTLKDLKIMMIKYIDELKAIAAIIGAKENIFKDMEKLRNMHSESNKFIADIYRFLGHLKEGLNTNLRL